MPRGGAWPGSGRPKGSRNLTAAELASRLDAIVVGTLPQKLSALAEDESAPQDVRLEALKRLFGHFAGRLTQSPPAAAP